MNILIISSPHPLKVAGTVAYNLYKGFKQKGHFAKLVVKPYGKYEEGIFCMESYRNALLWKLKIKVKSLLNYKNKPIRNINPDYCIQDLDESIEYYKTNDILKKAKFKPDIILNVFPGKFLNTKNLYELNKITNAPIFWYLMDSAALTGGCHYSWDCKRYTSGCGKCPALFSNDENDQTSENLKFKQKYLSKTDISIIAASELQYQMVLQSLFFKEKGVHKILLPVDSVNFRPVSKPEARRKLNVSENKKIIFFGSVSLAEKRKGIKYLIESLNIIKKSSACHLNDILLLVAGNKFDYIKDKLPFEYKYIGLLENNEQLATAFQMSDIFVCPSIEDSGPMMINQALMCGIPVVSFEMGVAFDLVITDKTGYIAKLRDSQDMAFGISKMLSLNKNEYDQYSSNCRKLAVDLCTSQMQIEKLENLFENKIRKQN